MKNKAYYSLPVYKNSLVLRDLSNALSYYFTSEPQASSRKTMGLRAVIAESLLNDTSLLPLTIEEAYKSGSLNNRLKSASFINIITRNIISYCNGLEKDGVKEREYIQLIRKELKTFRKSFKQWRKSLMNDPF
jgi:hypothetical protein